MAQIFIIYNVVLEGKPELKYTGANSWCKDINNEYTTFEPRLY